MLPGDARGNRLCLNSPHTWPESRRRKSEESDQGGKREERGAERGKEKKEEEGSGRVQEEA